MHMSWKQENTFCLYPKSCNVFILIYLNYSDMMNWFYSLRQNVVCALSRVFCSVWCGCVYITVSQSCCSLAWEHCLVLSNDHFIYPLACRIWLVREVGQWPQLCTDIIRIGSDGNVGVPQQVSICLGDNRFTFFNFKTKHKQFCALFW